MDSSNQSPPPLQFGRGESSVESSPIHTPSTATSEHFPSQHASGRPGLLADWSISKSSVPNSNRVLQEESICDDILFPQVGDDLESDAALFLPHEACRQPDPQYRRHSGTMPSPPINITAPSRPGSNSPQKHQSNLSSQFQRPQMDMSQDMDMDGVNGASVKGRQESIGMLGTTPYGARSIPTRDGLRRGSTNNLSGSLMGGMSWGGMSMGSYVRDE